MRSKLCREDRIPSNQEDVEVEVDVALIWLSLGTIVMLMMMRSTHLVGRLSSIVE